MVAGCTTWRGPDGKYQLLNLGCHFCNTVSFFNTSYKQSPNCGIQPEKYPIVALGIPIGGIVEPDIFEPILEPILEPIVESILLMEKQPETENLLIENVVLIKEIIIEAIPDIINPDLIAQAEELRKLILLQETIKRFSKKNLM